MKNTEFHNLLRRRRDEGGRPLWSIGKIAEHLYLNRSRLSGVFNNDDARRGGQTRPKLIKFFKREFEGTEPNWQQLLKALNWNEDSSVIAEQTEQTEGTENKPT